MTRLRKSLMWFFVLLGVKLSVVVGALTWLSSDHGNDWIRRQVVDLTNENVHAGRLEIGGLNTNLLSRLALDGIVFRDATGVKLVELDAVELQFDLSGVWRKEIRISELALERPWVHTSMDQDGQLDLLWALAGPSQQTQSPSAAWSGLDWRIGVERFSLRDGTVRVDDQRDPAASVLLEAISVESAVHIFERVVGLQGLRVDLDAVEPLDLHMGVTGVVGLHDGDLRAHDLRLMVGESKFLFNGGVNTWETRPIFDLSVTANPLSNADLRRFIGESGPNADLVLNISVAGPLDDVKVAGNVDTNHGVVDFQVWVDTDVHPIEWSIGLETEGLNVDQITSAVPEKTHLVLASQMSGQGTDWPDGLVADVTVAGGSQVLWGESVENLQVVAHLENGVVDISRFFADHPVGTVNVTGAVNVLDSTGDLGVDLQVPALARLKRFGLPGYGGAIAYSGVVEASWVDSAHIVGTTHGKIHGQRLKGAGAEVGLMNGSVTMELNGPAYSGTGTLRIDQVVADGLKIERLDLPFAGTWSEKEGGSGTVGRPESILARGVSIGDGAVGVTSVTGELRGGVDVAGVPFGRADVLLSDMLLGPAKLEAEGGPVTLVYEPEGVVAEIDLRRQDMPFLGGKVSGHPTDGNWVIDDLILAPSIDQRLEADGPVSFVLDEGGVRDLNLTLVKKSIVGQGDQAVDGDAQPFLALAGTLLPSDPMQTDLRAIMTEMNLAEVAKVVAMIDEAGTDGSHSLDGLKGLLNADLKLWGESGELAVDGQIKVGGLAIPGAMRADVEEGDYALAKRVDVDTVVWGTLSRPHVDLRVQAPVGRRPNKGTPREKEMMLALAGSFPLEEGPAGWRLDCRDAIDLQVVVPPGGTMRFRRLIQNLELPKGRMGAEMHMSGKACNPQMQFGGGGTFALGAGDEEVRLDWDIARNGDEVILESWLEHGLQRRLEVHGNLTARLNEVFEWALQDGEKPRVDDPLALVDQMALDILPMSFPLETLGAFGQLPEGLGGNIGGGLHLGGRPKKPVLTGGLVWVDGTLGGVRVEEGIWSMVPEQKGQDAVDDIVRSYHLESRLKFEGLGALSIVGTVPLMLNPNATAEQLLNAPGFALEITGEGLPLQVIAGSVEGLEDASGLVELSGTVAGTLAEPDINLKASMDGAAISSTETGVHYEDMKMELFLLSDRLFLQQLRFHTNPLWTRTQANTKDGVLYARGYVILSEEDVNQVEFDLELDRTWMVNAEGNAVVLSGEMAVDGVWPNLAVTGAVVTDHGKIDLGEELFADTSDLDLDPILSIHREGMVQVDDEDLKGFEEPPFWEDFDVDMTFDMQRKMNLKVEVPMSEGRGGNFAQLANITMEMDLDSPEMLHIRLADGDISVDGEVEILKNGSMHVLTGTFDVSGGTLVFSGKDYTEPSMDLSAIRSTGKYGDVQATVTGTPSAPQLAFSSEEYPDQADVISLLLFGKPASEMADTEGEAGAALMGAALSSVTGQVSQAFESSVVGSLELEDGAVQVGMPLSEKLYLTYAIKTNADEDENVNQASLEWLIQRRMYAEFVTGDAGQSSADLYWRWRF